VKKRLRQHINPLKMTSLVPRDEPLDLPLGVPVEVELGCGDARFIIDRARRQPDHHFVGLDIRGEFLDIARQEQAEQGPENLTLEETNLIVDADRLFAPARVRRFYINFPDPWFKRRQHNRRWLTAEILAQLVLSLEPRGEIFYQTDVWALAIESLALLEGSAELRNAGEEWTFFKQNPYGVKSSREMACEEEERPIWRMLFRSIVRPSNPRRPA